MSKVIAKVTISQTKGSEETCKYLALGSSDCPTLNTLLFLTAEESRYKKKRLQSFKCHCPNDMSTCYTGTNQVLVFHFFQ